MARINKGILGPLSGTVGTVIGGSWKGISYLRSQPASRKGRSSAEQLDHQLKFSIVMNFISTMTGLLQLTFKKYAIKMSEFNAAFSYNYYNALTGTPPDYAIDYAKALVSRGELPNATAPGATVTGKILHYTWTDNSGTGTALDADGVVLVAFCPGMNLTTYTIASAQRSAGAATLDCTNFSGQAVQTWIAFLSEDGKDASNSFFTGELTIA